MKVSGFSLLLAAVCALVALASIAVPAGAEQPPGDMRRIEVPTGELSPTLRPAEAPPPDFTASQYIDSAGCVFIRAEGGWRGRTDRDGTAVCGYPPTLSARRIGPDSTPALFPEPELPRAARIERDLTEAIIPNLQAAELARGGASGAAALPPVSPTGGQGPQAETPPDPLKIGAVVAKAPALSRQMAGPGRTDRLCALIGGSPANGAGLGLCGDAPPLASLSQVSPGAKDGRVTGQSVAARADSGTTVEASKADARRQEARIAAKEAPAQAGQVRLQGRRGPMTCA